MSLEQQQPMRDVQETRSFSVMSIELTESRRAELESQIEQLKKRKIVLEKATTHGGFQAGGNQDGKRSGFRPNQEKMAELEEVNANLEILTEALKSNKDVRQLIIPHFAQAERPADPTIIGPSDKDREALKDVRGALRKPSRAVNTALAFGVGAAGALPVVEHVAGQAVYQQVEQTNPEPTPIPTQVAAVYQNVEVGGVQFRLDHMEHLDATEFAETRNFLNLGPEATIFEVVFSEDFADLKMGVRNVNGQYYVYDKTLDNPTFTLVNPNNRDEFLLALGAEFTPEQRIAEVRTPAVIEVTGVARVRAEHNANGNLLTEQSSGVLEIQYTNGQANRVNAGGYDWYQVKTADGRIGWVAVTGNIRVPADTNERVTPAQVIPAKWRFPASARLISAERMALLEAGIDPESGVFPLFGTIVKQSEFRGVSRDSGIKLNHDLPSELTVESGMDRYGLDRTSYRLLRVHIIRTEHYEVDGKPLVRIYFNVKLRNGKMLQAYTDAYIRFMHTVNGSSREVNEMRRFDPSKPVIISSAEVRPTDQDTIRRFCSTNRDPEAQKAAIDACVSVVTLRTEVNQGEVTTDAATIQAIIASGGNHPDFDERKLYNYGITDQVTE